MSLKELKSKQDAEWLLHQLNAPKHLIQHVQLVGEVAEQLLKKCEDWCIQIDTDFVQMGVILHDIGKIQHPFEMSASGSKHEATGEHMLLELGVQPQLARCCVSHAQFDSMQCSLEELLIALSDTLWKGKRVEHLERRILLELAQLKGCEPWDLFLELDTHFESIAAEGYARLQRSVEYSNTGESDV